MELKTYLYIKGGHKMDVNTRIGVGDKLHRIRNYRYGIKRAKKIQILN